MCNKKWNRKVKWIFWFLSVNKFNLINFRLEFDNSNKAKIEDLFNYLYKIINYNYNTAMHLLAQCKAEQKLQIDQRTVNSLFIYIEWIKRT